MVGLAALVAGVVPSLIVTSPVLATDLPDNCSYLSYSYRIINFAGSWPSGTQTLAQNGFGWWSTVPDLAGNPAIQTSYGWHGQTEATWVTYGPADTWGIGICAGEGYMEFYNTTMAAYIALPDRFSSITAHEYGHVLGLGHAGRYDSWDGYVPVMATNRGTTYLRTDDKGGIQGVKHENTSDDIFWPTPNASFQAGTDGWKAERVAWSVNGYGAPGAGNKSIRIMANGAWPNRIWSEIRLDSQGHEPTGINLASFAKRPFSNTSGHISLAMNVGRVIFPRGETPGYPDKSGWDSSEINDHGVPTVTWVAWRNVDCYPTTGWQICAQTWSPPASNADSMDLVAYAYSYIYIAGTSTPSWVDIDQLSVLADFN